MAAAPHQPGAHPTPAWVRAPQAPRPRALPSRRLGRGRRGRTLLTVAAIAAGLMAVDAAPPARERVDLELGDGRTVSGEIVVEAEDGGLLLERPDGGYELVTPDRLAMRSAAAAPEPESPPALGRRILADLPPGFDLLVTKHYVICFATSRDYARWCGAVFERLHDAFVTYWGRAGLEVEPTERPLVVVIFADRAAYAEHAAAALGTAADRVAGYYDMLSNRVTTYDLTGRDAHADRRRAGTAGMAILASPEAAGLVSTLVHEATHQLAFNAGLHRRLAPVPLWVSEGIATYFETPDLRNARGWNGIGAVNGPRLKHFLETYRPGLLERMIRDDELLRRPETALDAYAAAWAVTHHLLQSRRAEFTAYLRRLAAKRPLAEDSAAVRLEEFRAAFGEPADVETRAFRAADRLAGGR